MIFVSLPYPRFDSYASKAKGAENLTMAGGVKMKDSSNK
jgi:hypothetical protein